MLNRLLSARNGPAAAEGGGDAPVTGVRVTMLLEPATAARLDTARLALPDADVRLVDGGLAGFAVNAPLMRRTDVLVVEIDPANPRAVEEFEQFVAAQAGRLPVVAAVRDLTVPITRRVLRSGAVDVLPIPFSVDDLSQVIETGRHHIATTRVATGGGSRQGHVVAFKGALGGVGTTTLATQAAQVWSEERSVCLIDLDIQSGNAALYLNLKPRLSLSDLVEAGDRLDGEFMRMVAERHKSGATVIAAPSEMMPLDTITPEFAERLLDICAASFDVVLVDLPTNWVDWSAAVMQKSDLIALVTHMTVPGVHQARRQMDVFQANGLSERLRIVMNRLTPTLFGKLDVSEAEAALKHRVHHGISNDYPTVQAAIDEGQLVSKIKMKSRVEKDFRAFVTDMANELAAMGAIA